MTTREQKERAAQDFSKQFHDHPIMQGGLRTEGFIAGAEWAESQMRWIPVEEALPEVGEYCLLVIGENTVLKGRLMANGFNAFYADGEKLVDDLRPVTSWQPLPEPPAKEDGKDE